MREDFAAISILIAVIAGMAVSAALVMAKMMGLIDVGLFLTATPVLFVFAFVVALSLCAIVAAAFKKD